MNPVRLTCGVAARFLVDGLGGQVIVILIPIARCSAARQRKDEHGLSIFIKVEYPF